MEIKQDINFFEKPLWFQSDISGEEGFIWKDQDGYVYRSKYRAPTHTDILFLMFLLLESQNEGYSEKLIRTRYQIIQGCGLSAREPENCKRLEDSLKRWGAVFISFEGCFYEGKRRVNKGFHIIDSYEIDGKRVEVNLNSKWIQAIKDSNFFKYINFNYYKSLKRPVSRRLFEILCKNFKGREFWEIGLTKLGEKLTLQGRTEKKKDGDIKEILYPSTVLSKVKPAINEINRRAEEQKFFEYCNIPAKEAFSISYKINGNNIVFSKSIPKWVIKEQQTKKIIKEEQDVLPFDEATLMQLFGKAKSQTKTIQDTIAKYYRDKGFEYVKWNIEYANKTATKNYATFLKKSLKEDWGKEFREIEEHKSETEKIYNETKQEQLSIGIKKDKEILALNNVYKNLPKEEQKKLWESAKKFYIANGINEKFLNKEMIMAQIRVVLKESGNTLPT